VKEIIYCFDQVQFFKRRFPISVILLIISIGLDVFFVWKLTHNIPESATYQPEVLTAWKTGYLFFIIINALVLKLFNVISYINDLRKWKNSYIEINDGEVIHGVENSFMSKRRLKFELGYVADDYKEAYLYQLKYRITKITDVEKKFTGAIKITGCINIDCLDEVRGFELGINDHRLNQAKRHVIPAYYKNMKLIEQELNKIYSSK
jgi:hypothetical protein